MTSRDFCYWLQGFFEVGGQTQVTDSQVTIIKNHLNMVFKHEIDPSHGDAAHQKVLSDAHQGRSSDVYKKLSDILVPGGEAKINC